jgi:hypothetical protein
VVLAVTHIMASRLVWKPIVTLRISRANEASRDLQVGSPSNVSAHQSTAAFPSLSLLCVLY